MGKKMTPHKRTNGATALTRAERRLFNEMLGVLTDIGQIGRDGYHTISGDWFMPMELMLRVGKVMRAAKEKIDG